MFIKIGLKYDVLNNDTVNESQTVRISTDSGNIVVTNVDVAPNVDIHKSSMNTLFKGNKTVVVGDLNAKSQLWGSPEQNNRGNVLEELGNVLKELGNVLEELGNVLEELGNVLEELGNVLEELGNVLEELIEENDFVVVNTGQPTYQIHHCGTSHLDVTFASRSLRQNVIGQ